MSFCKNNGNREIITTLFLIYVDSELIKADLINLHAGESTPLCSVYSPSWFFSSFLLADLVASPFRLPRCRFIRMVSMWTKSYFWIRSCCRFLSSADFPLRGSAVAPAPRQDDWSSSALRFCSAGGEYRAFACSQYLHPLRLIHRS